MGTFRPGRPDHATAADVSAAINARLDRQEGRISFAQLKDIGLDARAIATRRKNGELLVDSRRRNARNPDGRATNREMTQRVYRAPGASKGPDGLRWSAVLSAPGQGFVDHVSALQLAGLEPYQRGPIHVVVNGSGWNPPLGVKDHRTRTLPARDRRLIRGIPSVSIPRALLTAAPDIKGPRLHDILDTAVAVGKYNGNAVVETVERFQTVPGYAPLMEAIAALDATSGTFRSIFERRTKRLAERSPRIPPLVVNELLEGYRPDLHIPGTRVIIECDGRDYHRSPAQIIADDERQRILERLGYRFLRLRWAQVVYEEDRTLARIEEFVLNNLAAPVPGR